MTKSKSMVCPSEQQVAEAISWLVKMESGELSANDHQALEHWKDQSQQNLVAWQRLEKANHHFTSSLKSCDLKAEQIHNSFAQTDEYLDEKRRTLKTLFALTGLGFGLWVTRHHTGINRVGRHVYGKSVADLTTGLGEQKKVYLPDGSELMLNTQSALNINFDSSPQLYLHYGELAIKNSGETQFGFADHVFTPAKGSEFTLLKVGDQCEINMINGKGKCNLSKRYHAVIDSGQRLVIYPDSTFKFRDVDEHIASWKKGLIIAEQMPLGRFIAQLSRYHSGYIGCSDYIANLTLSGSFPVSDTLSILDNLVQILPIEQRRFGKYWVYLMPA